MGVRELDAVERLARDPDRDDAERAAIAQMSVFRGGASADAAEAVVVASGAYVLDVLDSLREKSLLRVGDDRAGTRFAMDETVRLYAEEAGLRPVGFTADAREALLSETWPGNVRELSERVRQAIRLAGDGSITAFNVGYRHEFGGDNTANPGPPHTVSAVVGIEGHLVQPEDLEPGDPPFQLFQSGRGNPGDGGASAAQSLLARARDLGIPAQAHVVEGATHPQLIREPYVREVIRRAAPFLQRHLACS